MSKVEQGASRVELARSRGTLTCGAERGELWLALTAANQEALTVRAPWRGQIGGVALIVSPDERHAALHVISGQSEEGCAVFALEPTMRHVGTLPLARGEGPGPVFAPDSSWLVSLSTSEFPRIRETGQYFEEAQDESSDARVIVDWAVLRALRIHDGVVHEAAVGAEIPLSTDIDEVNEWKTYRLVKSVSGSTEVHSLIDFVANDELIVGAPWEDGGRAGAESMSCPLPPRTTLTAR